MRCRSSSSWRRLLDRVRAAGDALRIRSGVRNDSRTRTVSIPAGDGKVKILKLRKGNVSTMLVELHRRIKQDLSKKFRGLRHRHFDSKRCRPRQGFGLRFSGNEADHVRDVCQKSAVRSESCISTPSATRCSQRVGRRDPRQRVRRPQDCVPCGRD